VDLDERTAVLVAQLRSASSTCHAVRPHDDVVFAGSPHVEIRPVGAQSSRRLRTGADDGPELSAVLTACKSRKRCGC